MVRKQRENFPESRTRDSSTSKLRSSRRIQQDQLQTRLSMSSPVLFREAGIVGPRDLTYSIQYNRAVDHNPGYAGNPVP